MATNDPAVVQSVLNTAHAAFSSLLERLDNLERNGVLSEPAAEASRGWRDRAARSLGLMREHLMEPVVVEEAPVPPAPPSPPEPRRSPQTRSKQ